MPAFKSAFAAALGASALAAATLVPVGASASASASAATDSAWVALPSGATELAVGDTVPSEALSAAVAGTAAETAAKEALAASVSASKPEIVGTEAPYSDGTDGSDANDTEASDSEYTGWVASQNAAAEAANGTAVVAAATWSVACGRSASRLHIVKNFAGRRRARVGSHTVAGGSSALACGRPETWGYRHIINGHLDDWENLGSLAGENWRDTANTAINSAFRDPDWVTYRAQNDTFCYTHIIYLVNKRTGQVRGTSRPRTVIGRVTKNIITSYPSSGGC
jgi:hypothetical protein